MTFVAKKFYSVYNTVYRNGVFNTDRRIDDESLFIFRNTTKRIRKVIK